MKIPCDINNDKANNTRSRRALLPFQGQIFVPASDTDDVHCMQVHPLWSFITVVVGRLLYLL